MSQESDDLPWFVLAMAIMGVLYGLFFSYRDRIDALEDIALELAVLDPTSTDESVEWLRCLDTGECVELSGAFVTLTPEGVNWTGLRKGSLNWPDIEVVRARTRSFRGLRSARMVHLHVNGKEHSISCTKRNFGDVLATCSAMARAAVREPDPSSGRSPNPTPPRWFSTGP